MAQVLLTPTTRAQINRLLPADVAEAFHHDDVAPQALGDALARLRTHLEAILPLIPPPVARQHLQTPAPGVARCERWQGSLLFADLSGFTALSEQLAGLGREGSEVVTDVVNRLFSALAGEVDRYGGDLLKFGGDALTAFFPAALRGEDHARLAVAAALGMQQQMAATGLVQTRGGQHQLRLRTGVHSGSAFAAQLGDQEHMELLLTGADVNQVARAQEVALPGEVVVTGATLALLSQAQVVERDQGFFALQDFAAPAQRPGAPLPLPPRSGDLSELSALAQAISALELFLPQGVAEAGVIADERLASGFRLVTVLFAHVAPLSSLLEQLPPDVDPAPLLNSYYRRMQHAVLRFGGSVNKLDMAADGDKLLVCFGAPLAQEQHQELAVRAALAMQAGLEQARAEIAGLAPGLPALVQEIGINTGHVFAGLVGTPTRREYTVMGDVVNLAARLMAYADPGAIWISPATQRSLEHLFDCRPLPPLTVKGKAAPIEPFAVLSAFETERSRTGASALRTSFVGRRAEQEQLYQAAVTALSGSGRAVVLTGEAGVGKSRLIEELISSLSLASLSGEQVPAFTLLTTECQSYEQTLPFASLRDLLQQLLRMPGAGGAEAQQQAERLKQRVNDLVPELARFTPLLGEVLGLPLPETPLIASLRPEQRRDRTHDLLVNLFGAAAQQQPLAVVWDDLHWCDASSLDALQALLQAASRYPLLLIIGMRPDPALYKPIGEQVLLIHLRELDAAAGAELVTTLLKGRAPAALLERLRTTDEGYNPFFVEELLRSLAESGTLVQRDGGWELAGNPDELVLPSTIEDVIAARVDRLELRQRETLQEASVIGRRFLYPILAGIAEEHAALLQRLAGLSAAELVLPEDEQAYLFKHMLTRDAVYASILYARRRRLHRRVAERIEELFGERLDDQLPLLARHYYAAEEWEQALRYSMAAGRRAQEHYHNREALALFEMALEALVRCGPLPDAEIEAYERIGIARFHTGQYEEAHLALERALAILQTQQPQDRNRIAGVYHHLARVAERRTAYGDAFRLVEQGLALLQEGESSQLSALLLAGAGLYQRQGHYDKALEWAQKGLDIAHMHQNASDTAHAYGILSSTHMYRGQYRIAAEMGQQSLQFYTQIGDLVGESDARINIANVLTQLGRRAEAADYFRSARQLKEQLADVYGIALVSVNLGDLLYKNGEYAEAMREFMVALERFEALGSQFGVAVVHMNMGAVSLADKDFVRARYHLDTSLALFEQIGSDMFMAELYRYRANLAHEERQLERALDDADRALEYAHRLSATAEEGAIQRIRGAILRELGRKDEALAALRRARAVLQEVENADELLACLKEIARLTDDPQEEQEVRGEIAEKQRRANNVHS